MSELLIVRGMGFARDPMYVTDVEARTAAIRHGFARDDVRVETVGQIRHVVTSGLRAGSEVRYEAIPYRGRVRLREPGALWPCACPGCQGYRD